MLKVFFTVDVEIWCDGWTDLDNKFNNAFQRYIYGATKKGGFGLPYQLGALNDHGLIGSFFVEPLFALRFGLDPLTEITGLITESNQPVELHLHTEWVDESPPFLDHHIKEKRQYLRDFSLVDQIVLINKGKELLSQAGVSDVNAFRAGSFGFNSDTLIALRENNIFIDSSYNATKMGLDSGLAPGKVLTQSMSHETVYEVPMTVYFDRPGNLRHTQLCACSFSEMEGLLWQALEEGREEFVILSHSFELLKNSQSQPDFTVIKRFKKLCEFLDKNRDCFSTRSFSDFSSMNQHQPAPLKSPLWRTGKRYLEQAWSRYV